MTRSIYMQLAILAMILTFIFLFAIKIYPDGEFFYILLFGLVIGFAWGYKVRDRGHL